ncbi:MAG: proline iminopeptidase-family hydrolase [Anaerolineales bacterium]|nr:proline iminopeptidase-family hydrolase [Anaerolineales bacterium]
MILERETTIAVPGGKVWCLEMGEGDGLPLLVLHGGPGSTHNSYYEPLTQLAHKHRIILYDQLGCGHSERPDDPSLWTLARFVEEVEAVRAHFGLKQFALLGHSWGGALAMDYMMTYGTAVARLILMGPLLSTALWLADAQRLKNGLPSDVVELMNQHEQAGTTDSADYNYAVNMFYEHHVCRVKEVPERVRNGRKLFGRAVYNYMWGDNEFTCTGTLATYNRVADLPQIKVPTLFLCGQYDEATPETVQSYQQLVKGSQMHVFANCSHAPQLEDPQTFVTVLSQFLG